MKQPSEIADLKEEPIILGRRRFDVIHTPGHTKGSVCLLDRENNLLFSGDTVCGRRVMLSFEESETGDVFKESIKRLTEVTNADTEIYCGHSRRPLKKEVLNKYYVCASALSGQEKRERMREETSVFGTCFVFPYGDVELTCKKRG